MFENTGTQNIEDLGEFGLITHLTKAFEPKNLSTIKAVGDDAAVIDTGSETKMLITTDILAEGVHFDLSYVPMKHLGYKAITVNLSDIYAMNAQPTQVTVSLALSSKITVDALEELYEGINLACKNYKVDLVGGDTTSSQSGLVISVTAIGFAKLDEIVYRNNAKENDLICVTGDLGAAYLGLQILEREKQVFLTNPNIQPELEGFDYLIERQLKPEAGKLYIEEFKKHGVKPSAMIDISDGLASEIHHICSQSGVGATIYEDKLPIDPLAYDTALNFKLDSSTCMLNGGEDYELLFTIPQSQYENVKKVAGVSIIGHITEAVQGINLVSKSENVHKIEAQGWNHFKPQI